VNFPGFYYNFALNKSSYALGLQLAEPNGALHSSGNYCFRSFLIREDVFKI
jgi:hypothetical protein